MRVRVRDRAGESPWGHGRTDPRVIAVDIADTCPRCGGPRGIPHNLNQHDDGCFYSVDVWSNPCGHTDLYADVVREARGR